MSCGLNAQTSSITPKPTARESSEALRRVSSASLLVAAADRLGHQDRAADRGDLEEHCGHLDQAGDDDLGGERVNAQLPRQYRIEEDDAIEQRLLGGHLQRER